MALTETLLAIRREFTKDEKYKLLLKHLINVEDELRADQKKIVTLIKKNKELSKEFDLVSQELLSYKGDTNKKKFVSVKAYEKLKKVKSMWVVRFWEVNAELETLKNQTL